MKTNPFTISLLPALLLAVSLSTGLSIRAAEPLKTGAEAPDFKLATLDGKTVSLNQEREKLPVVLVVLRGWPGYQCPICTRQVSDFIQHAGDFAGQARVIMVYPGPAEDLKAHAEEFLHDTQWPKEFLFVTDPDYTFTTAYGLRWAAPKETAYPSTFVIDTAGKIRLAKPSQSHGGRLSAADAAKALAGLK